MAIISSPITFSAGQTITASDTNTNNANIYTEFNGSIDNANIKALAGIVDTKLAQITTAAKVSGTAITSFDSVRTAGVTAATATATPVTLFSAATLGVYLVYAWIVSGTSTAYTAFSVVMSVGVALRAVSDDSSNLTITASGTNVQATQISGTTIAINYYYLKIM